MKKITKEKGTKKKKISCLELSLFQFLDICVLLSFTFVHWLLSMDYCTKRCYSEAKKYDILWSREVGGLVVCGYDGISVLFKKNYFLYLFPSSDSAMKTRLTVCHYVLSVIWLWRFCLLNIRPESETLTEILLSVILVTCRFLKGTKGTLDKNILSMSCFWRGFSCGLTQVSYSYVNTPVFLEKKTVLLLERCLLYSTVTLTFGSFEAEGLLFGRRTMV